MSKSVSLTVERRVFVGALSGFPTIKQEFNGVERVGGPRELTVQFEIIHGATSSTANLVAIRVGGGFVDATSEDDPQPFTIPVDPATKKEMAVWFLEAMATAGRLSPADLAFFRSAIQKP